VAGGLKWHEGPMFAVMPPYDVPGWLHWDQGLMVPDWDEDPFHADNRDIIPKRGFWQWILRID